jgi:hypothetical protein
MEGRKLPSIKCAFQIVHFLISTVGNFDIMKLWAVSTIFSTKGCTFFSITLIVCFPSKSRKYGRWGEQEAALLIVLESECCHFMKLLISVGTDSKLLPCP